MEADILLWIQKYIRHSGLSPVIEAITHLGDFGFFWIFFGNLFFSFPCSSEMGFLISFPGFSSILQVVSLEILHFFC